MPLVASRVEYSGGRGRRDRKPKQNKQKKATKPRPPRQRGTVECPICKRVCQGPREYAKHHKKVHKGRRFPCDFCNQKFTTAGNKKKHEHNNCLSEYSPAQVGRKRNHQKYNPEEGESSGEDMRVSGEEGEYKNPQETTKDQGARGIKDRNRREKPKEYEKRATPLLQPPPKTPGESQTKG